MTDHPRDTVLLELEAERLRQDRKWGEQNHRDGTGNASQVLGARIARANCQERSARGCVTWADILEEEMAEALAESDPARLREELVQVAAVAVSWVEAIDRRSRD